MGPMVDKAGAELAGAGITDQPGIVLADAGYWHGEQIDRLMGQGVKVLIPPDADKRRGTRPGWDGGRYAFMRNILDTPAAGELYAQRQRMIEPVFADTKFNRRADRFLRRGRAAAPRGMAPDHCHRQPAEDLAAHHRPSGGLTAAGASSRRSQATAAPPPRRCADTAPTPFPQQPPRKAQAGVRPADRLRARLFRRTRSHRSRRSSGRRQSLRSSHGNLDTDMPPSEGAMEATGAASLFTVSPTRGGVIRWRRAAAGGGGADGSVADQLRALGVKGVLVQMAERGQLLALKCEMPQCYHHKGRGAFDEVATPRTKWAPSPDHYPILKVGRRAPRRRERSTVPHLVQQPGLWMADADPDAARERQVPRRDRRGPEQQGCPAGRRYEPMDGRHGAQGLRVLVLP